MFCPKCGKEIKGNPRFCPFCGSEITIQENAEPRKNTASKHFFKYIFLMLCVLVLGVSFGFGSYYLLRDKMDKNNGDQINVNEIVEGNGISRYEWMKMLCENYSIKEYKETTAYFPDVTDDSEYFIYIQAAVEHGILEPKDKFNGEALVTGKYAAVTICKAIGESAFVIYTGDETAWTNDKYVNEAVELGIIDAEKLSRTLNEEECSDIIGKAVYIENAELWRDDYVNIEYKKGTYEIDDSVITFLADDCNEISLAEGKYQKGDSLVFHNKQGFVNIKTIVAVNENFYLLEDADLDKVLEKYYVSDIAGITLEDICSTGEWKADQEVTLDTSYSLGNDSSFINMELGGKSGETSLYENGETFIISLEGTEGEPLKINIKNDKGLSASKTLDNYIMNCSSKVSVEIKNLKVKYRYDYWGTNNKIVVDCDSAVKGEMEVEKDLVNIPIWEPIPNISLGNDTVNISMGLFFSVTAKGEVYFSFNMPISAGVENIATIIKPVIQIRSVDSPVFCVEGELFAGLKFKVEATIFGRNGSGIDCELDVGAKVNSSLTTRNPDELNHILACADVKATAPYVGIEAAINITDDFKHEYEYEQGFEIPYKLHVELYSSGTPRAAVVTQCTYTEKSFEESEDSELDNTANTANTVKKHDIDQIDYEGEIWIIENNGDGTYKCKVRDEEVTLFVSDDAEMRIISFTDNPDPNGYITVSGAEFKKLEFGFDSTYGKYDLYDFAGDFPGKAKIKNGVILSFDKNFRS